MKLLDAPQLEHALTSIPSARRLSTAAKPRQLFAPWLSQGAGATFLLWLAGPLIAFVVTSQWFYPGRFLAGGDIFPTTFINPGLWMSRVLYAWDTTAPFGGTAAFTPRLPQIVLATYLRVFLPAIASEHAFYAILFGGQFMAMVFLTLTLLPGQRLVAFLAALFYCFNPYMVLVPPNNTAMFFLAYAPYMVALFIRLAARPINRLRTVVFVLSASISGYLFNNPPQFLLFIVTSLLVVGCVVWTHRHKQAEIWRRIAFYLPLFLLANLYWIVPSYFQWFGAAPQQGGSSSTALSWAWTGQRASILNLFWLNPTWAWDYYFPYAPIYRTPLLSFVIYLPTLLAFSALLNKAIDRRLVSLITALSLALLLLSTGLHGPWQAITTFFYVHVPLFWLFREPDSKFTLVLLTVYAPLVGYQAAWLCRTLGRVASWRTRLAAALRSGLVALIGAAFVLTAFPLVTGAIVGRGYAKPSSIGTAIPPYWERLGQFLASRDTSDGVLLLPNDDFYQMPYTWYYGADVVAAEFLPNPAVTLFGNSDNPTIRPLSTYDGFNSRLLQLVASGSHASLVPYLAAQHVRYIVERNDVNAAYPGRHILDPRRIRLYLHAQRDVHFVRSFGQLDLYEIDPARYLPAAFAVTLPARDAAAPDQRQLERDAWTALGLLDPHGTAGRGRHTRQTTSRISRVSLSQQRPTSLVAHMIPTTSPVLLVLSAAYHPNWHACIVPVGRTTQPWTCLFSGFMPPSTHVQALGFYNGWIIRHPGRYTVVLDYGFQHAATFAALISTIVIAGAVGWGAAPWLLRYGRRLRRLARLTNARV